MYYVIDKPALLESIKEEVSHVADAAYAEDGTSLYDSVMVTMRDKRKLQGFIDDAVSQFVRREFDITKYDPEVHYYTDELGNETTQVAYVTPRLILHVPDFDSSMEETANAELDRYTAGSAWRNPAPDAPSRRRRRRRRGDGSGR